jgi:hypothetical protein
MAHFAQVKDGYVLRVIVAEQDVIDSGIVGDPSEWYKTSYNTRGGVHYDPVTNLPDGGVAFRKNFAVPMGTYDAERDAFIPPKTIDYKGVVCQSWVLNEETCLWEAPTPQPEMTETHHYVWNESTTSYDEVSNT